MSRLLQGVGSLLCFFLPPAEYRETRRFTLPYQTVKDAWRTDAAALKRDGRKVDEYLSRFIGPRHYERRRK